MDIHKYIVTLDTPQPEDLYYPNGIVTSSVGNEYNEDSFREGWKGDVDVLRDERTGMVNAIAEAGVPLVVLPRPLKSFRDPLGMTEAIDYVRDPIAVSRQGEVLLFNMAAERRRPEAGVHELFANALGLKPIRSQRGFNEGGNSRVLPIPDEHWIFASTSVRSDRNGLDEQADFLGIPDSRRRFMDIIGGKGFHFDCIFMVAVDGNSVVHVASYMDAFPSDSRRTIEEAVRSLDGNLYELELTDVDNMAPNQLFTGCKIFRTGSFANYRTESTWTSLPGVEVTTFPLTQNFKTGGQVHCLTQEVYTPEPLDAALVAAALSQHPDVFGTHPKVEIFNNHQG